MDFVIPIVAICTFGWLINTWIRARHGYALEDEWGGKTPPADHVAASKLAEENAQLRKRIEALESRTAAVEAIVTDSAFDTSRQIEALRRESVQLKEHSQ